MTVWHFQHPDHDDLPLDGQRVLAFWSGVGAMVAYHDARTQEWYTVPPHEAPGVPALAPDAWMPLPPPPEIPNGDA
jgi:hypothetical protein